jgi:DNA end-binding protein Ku
MGVGGSRLRQQYVTDSAPTAEGPPVEEQEMVEEEPEEPKAAPAPRGAASRVLDFPTSKRELPPAPPAYQPPVAAPAVVERSGMVKGYEFEKGKFVLFTAEELKALEEGSRQTIDIVAFIPQQGVDPIYYDKAYFLAPDKRGAKPYNLLLRAMLDTGRCALAKWAFRSKEYVVQIRPADGGMVLQQLLYAEEVRSLADLDIERVDVSDAELKLAKQLIEQISVDTYDPTEFVDEEKKRILAAVEEKIAGKQIVAPEHVEPSSSAQVLDLVAALRASLQQKPSSAAPTEPAKNIKQSLGERKPAKRAPTRVTGEAAPPKGRANKK